MAEPFLFIPEPPAPPSPFHGFYSTTPHPTSPFLPPSPLLHAASPFLGTPSLPSGSSASAPGSPQPFVPHGIFWAGSAVGSPNLAPPVFDPRFAPFSVPQRQRTTSWHAQPVAPGTPFMSPVVPNLPPLFSPRGTPAFGLPPASPWLGATGPDPWAAASLFAPAPAPAIPPVHPCLDGAIETPLFHFDLALKSFSPLRIISAAQNVKAELTSEELREPAFYPTRTAVRIMHPRLAFYPIDLNQPELAEGVAAAAFPPIALGDVLVAIHRSLHTRITPDDWEVLSQEEQAAVGQAFTRRCRNEAAASTGGVPAAHWKEIETAERNEGVKRVDFLVGKTMFKGLVRSEEDPDGVFRFISD
ncbi:hypothetical protein HMN09_00153600 [Mycena chlorophos]|uniref:DUF6699 domain-containing protein n=1 Tax=Mycena chlorophos TaxID=658473 RepID=A0A8H6WJA4_MYCCL|nr:hypothetical protein HMN09_00153600 [Mycena chlorophos]